MSIAEQSNNQNNQNNDLNKFKSMEKDLYDLKINNFRIASTFESLSKNMEMISESLNIAVKKLEKQALIEERLNYAKEEILKINNKIEQQEKEAASFKNKIIFAFISLIVSIVLIFVRTSVSNSNNIIYDKKISFNTNKNNYNKLNLFKIS